MIHRTEWVSFSYMKTHVQFLNGNEGTSSLLNTEPGTTLKIFNKYVLVIM